MHVVGSFVWKFEELPLLAEGHLRAVMAWGEVHISFKSDRSWEAERILLDGWAVPADGINRQLELSRSSDWWQLVTQALLRDQWDDIMEAVDRGIYADRELQRAGGEVDPCQQ